MDEPILRQATVTDIPTLARHRSLMFVEMGRMVEADVPLLSAATALFLEEAIPKGDYVPFILEIGGKPVSSGGIQLRTIIARPAPGGLPMGTFTQGCVLGIYCEPTFRGQGHAKAIMCALMDWAKENHIPSLVLHASDAGRPMYEKLGFKQTTEMSYFIDAFDYALR